MTVINHEMPTAELLAFLAEANDFSQFADLQLDVREAVRIAIERLRYIHEHAPRAGEEIVRVVRVLEYTGPRSWVEHTLANNAVKGEYRLGDKCVIREASLGVFPEVL